MNNNFNVMKNTIKFIQLRKLELRIINKVNYNKIEINKNIIIKGKSQQYLKY